MESYSCLKRSNITLIGAFITMRGASNIRGVSNIIIINNFETGYAKSKVKSDKCTTIASRQNMSLQYKLAP